MWLHCKKYLKKKNYPLIHTTVPMFLLPWNDCANVSEIRKYALKNSFIWINPKRLFSLLILIRLWDLFFIIIVNFLILPVPSVCCYDFSWIKITKLNPTILDKINILHYFSNIFKSILFNAFINSLLSEK